MPDSKGRYDPFGLNIVRGLTAAVQVLQLLDRRYSKKSMD